MVINTACRVLLFQLSRQTARYRAVCEHVKSSHVYRPLIVKANVRKTVVQKLRS
jgi:hypothetical protein